ncbi:MAG: hypothetical protein ACK4PI_05845 [Tepidisphaerales bacterium]
MFAPADPTTPPSTLDLDGRRVLVVGTGEPLARTLARLHRLGAACQAVDDPYHAAALLASRADFVAVVVVLPCLYPEELAFVGAVRRMTGLPVIIAAADGLLAALSAAIRDGAAFLLTDTHLDSLLPAHPAAAPSSSSAPASTATSAPAASASTGAPMDAAAGATAKVPSSRGSATSATAVPPPTVPTRPPNGPMRQASPLGVEPSAPAAIPDAGADLQDETHPMPDSLLTAEELRALLHDPFPPTPRGVSHSLAVPPTPPSSARQNP